MRPAYSIHRSRPHSIRHRVPRLTYRTQFQKGFTCRDLGPFNDSLTLLNRPNDNLPDFFPPIAVYLRPVLHVPRRPIPSH